MCETEYIERNALLERLNERLSNLRKQCGFYDHYADGYNECVSEIVDALAADVVEVRHGEWVHNRDTGDERCTVCGFEWWDGCQECGVRPSNTNYCPHCGTKMDGKGYGE